MLFNYILEWFIKDQGVVKEMKKELISILKKENLKNISEAVGINA